MNETKINAMILAACFAAPSTGSVRSVPELRARVLAAYNAAEVVDAAAGHVSSLETEHGPAEASDAYDCFDAGSLPRPAGFDPRIQLDQAIIRAALAQRIRDSLEARA